MVPQGEVGRKITGGILEVRAVTKRRCPTSPIYRDEIFSVFWWVWGGMIGQTWEGVGECVLWSQGEYEKSALTVREKAAKRRPKKHDHSNWTIESKTGKKGWRKKGKDTGGGNRNEGGSRLRPNAIKTRGQVI